MNISIPEFTVVPLTKGWMQVKGDFAVGRSFDKDYLANFTNNKQTYVDTFYGIINHYLYRLRIHAMTSRYPV